MGAGTCPTRGWQTFLYTQDAGDTNDWDELFYPQSVTLAKKVQTIDMAALRGNVQHHTDNHIQGTYEVAGQISMYACPSDLDIWLPRILGDTGVSPWVPSGTLPAFDALVDRIASDGTGTKFDYQDLVVTKATFTGKAREPVMLTLDVMGLTRGALVSTAGAGTRTSTLDNRPYLFQNSTLTFGGNSLLINDFTLTIDNAVEADWQNSETPTSLCTTDSRITLGCNSNWTTANATNHFETMSGAGVLTLAATGLSCVFTMADLKKVSEDDPSVSARGKIPYALNFEAYQSGPVGTLVDSLSVANDSTV